MTVARASPIEASLARRLFPVGIACLFFSAACIASHGWSGVALGAEAAPARADGWLPRDVPVTVDLE